MRSVHLCAGSRSQNRGLPLGAPGTDLRSVPLAPAPTKEASAEQRAPEAKVTCSALACGTLTRPLAAQQVIRVGPRRPVRPASRRRSPGPSLLAQLSPEAAEALDMELAQALVTSSRYSASARRYSASAIGALQPFAGRAPLSARPWPLSPRSRLMRGPRARSRGRQRPIHGCLRSCLSHPRQFALKFWRLSESTEHDPICHRVLDAGRQRPRVAGAGPRPSRAIPIHAAAADQDTAVIVSAELFAYSRRSATGAGPKAVALGSVSRHAAARPIGLTVDT